ncbi:MAG: radical SAM protein [Elusimicrobia bacterium]|nr:radical SAM protein [Elusimicrobiota bacterium]
MFNKEIESVVWELTLQCNANCIHCGSSAGKLRENELTLEESLNICEQIAETGCRYVNLIGGEVFLYPHWKEIIKKFNFLGVRTSVITNAILLTKENLDFLKEQNIAALGISIDGGTPQTHDGIRRVPGLFDKIFKTIKYAGELKLPAVAITTLSKKNILELDILKEKIPAANFRGWQLQMAVPYGRMAEEIMLDAYEYYIAGIFAAQTERRKLKENFEVFRMHDFGYYSKLIPSQKSFFAWRGCPAGGKVLGLRSDGKVTGCLSMYEDKFAQGDLRKEPLSDIINNKNFCAWNHRLKKFKTLKGFCADCEYGLVCLAGCSNVSHGVTGGTGENPFCYHAIEVQAAKTEPKNDFEKIFRQITLGKIGKDGTLFLDNGQPLTAGLIDSLQIEGLRRQLLKLLL